MSTYAHSHPRGIPIADQLAEVERELRSRERYYPDAVAKGRFKAETADIKLADLRAAAATLRTIAQHADGLRVLIQFLRLHQTTEPSALERELLMGHPAVAEVLRTFPGATLRSVGPIVRPSADVPAQHEDTDA